jgi:hypothetical protein
MRWISLGLVCALALACASGAKAPPTSVMQFVDSQMFDDSLRDALSADMPEVTVSFSGASVTVNEIPDRLDSWLYSISKRNGGKVEVTPDPALPAARSPIALALSFGLTGFKLVREQYHYFPARQYDAFVYHDPTSGVLTRVVFVHVPKS